MKYTLLLNILMFLASIFPIKIFSQPLQFGSLFLLNPDPKIISFALKDNENNKISYFDKYPSIKMFTRLFNQSTYLDRENEDKFFQTESELFYSSGSKKWQSFMVNHTQELPFNFRSRINYLTNRENGYYLQTKHNSRNLFFDLKFNSHDSVYSFQINYLTSKDSKQENGGLADDTQFENSSSSQNELLNINYNKAERMLKIKQYYAEQKINISRKFHKTDSVVHFDRNWSIRHQINYRNAIDLFNWIDLDANLVPEIYYDSLSTYDSISLKSLINEIELNYNRFDSEHKNFLLHNSNYAFILGYQVLRYRQLFIDTSFKSTWTGIEGHLKLNDQIKFQFSVKNLFQNHNSYFTANSLWQWAYMGNKFFISLFAEHIQSKPSLNYLFYDSNNFRWNNEFKTENRSSVQLISRINILKNYISTTLTYRVQDNFCYFNENASPQQSEKRFGVFSLQLTDKTNLRKWLLESNIIYSHSEDHEVYRLPKFQVNQSFCFRSDILSARLQMEVGLRAGINSKYLANAYMPLTGFSYLQNEKKIGGYPYLDFWIENTIKQATIGISIFHINEGWLKRTYYSAPHYPADGRRITFSIRWKLFD